MQKIPIRHISATQKEPVFSEQFSIRNIQQLLSGEDMIQELHRHDFFYILALEKGAGDHEIDFTSYEVRDHTVYFMNPGQVHQLLLKASSTGYLLQFKSDFFYTHDKRFNELLRKAGSINCYQLDDNRFKKLQSILAYIFQECTNKQEKYEDVVKSNLEILFVQLIRQQRPMASKTIIPYTQERLDEFLGLLETNISTHKQVTEYAGLLNLTTYQLNAITKEALGKTCSEVISEYIILESKRHLLATSSQVNQIADHLGYEDVSYFIRFFKKQTGYSPESFRQNFR